MKEERKFAVVGTAPNQNTPGPSLCSTAMPPTRLRHATFAHSQLTAGKPGAQGSREKHWLLQRAPGERKNRNGRWQHSDTRILILYPEGKLPAG